MQEMPLKVLSNLPYLVERYEVAIAEVLAHSVVLDYPGAGKAINEVMSFI